MRDAPPGTPPPPSAVPPVAAAASAAAAADASAAAARPRTHAGTSRAVARDGGGGGSGGLRPRSQQRGRQLARLAGASAPARVAAAEAPARAATAAGDSRPAARDRAAAAAAAARAPATASVDGTDDDEAAEVFVLDSPATGGESVSAWGASSLFRAPPPSFNQAAGGSRGAGSPGPASSPDGSGGSGGGGAALESLVDPAFRFFVEARGAPPPSRALPKLRARPRVPWVSSGHDKFGPAPSRRGPNVHVPRASPAAWPARAAVPRRDPKR